MTLRPSPCTYLLMHMYCPRRLDMFLLRRFRGVDLLVLVAISKQVCLISEPANIATFSTMR